MLIVTLSKSGLVQPNMPKIISHTPSWLSRPSPGFHLFSPHISTEPKRGIDRGSHQFANGSKNKRTRVGHVKIIARRGSEIFVVVDNEIRWSDLCMLKRDWEQGEKECSSKRKPTGVEAANGTPVTEAGDWRAGNFQSQNPTLAHCSCRFSNIQLVKRFSSFLCLQMEAFSPFRPHIQFM